jgi:hypothetical protein
MEIEKKKGKEFSFEKNFSFSFLKNLNSNGSIQIFQKDTNITISCFGPQQNVIF